MAKSFEEANELCKKYEVNLKDYQTVIVTGNDSIYVSDNIDPSDLSELFVLKKNGEVMSASIVSDTTEPIETVQDTQTETLQEDSTDKKKK